MAEHLNINRPISIQQGIADIPQFLEQWRNSAIQTNAGNPDILAKLNDNALFADVVATCQKEFTEQVKTGTVASHGVQGLVQQYYQGQCVGSADSLAALKQGLEQAPQLDENAIKTLEASLKNSVAKEAAASNAPAADAMKQGFVAKHFATNREQLSGIWKDGKGVTFAKGARVAGAGVGLGAAFYFGGKAIKGVQIDMETGETKPMSFVQRTTNAVAAVAGVLGAVASVAYKGRTV